MRNKHEVIKKKWGYEKIIVNTDEYCGKILVMKPRSYGSYHCHENKDETFLNAGKCTVVVNIEGHLCLLHPGGSLRVMRLIGHAIYNLDRTHKAIIIEFSTHDDSGDTRRLDRSGLFGNGSDKIVEEDK